MEGTVKEKAEGDSKNVHLRKRGQEGKLVYFTGHKGIERTTVLLGDILFDTYNFFTISCDFVSFPVLLFYYMRTTRSIDGDIKKIISRNHGSDKQYNFREPEI